MQEIDKLTKIIKRVHTCVRLFWGWILWHYLYKPWWRYSHQLQLRATLKMKTECSPRKACIHLQHYTVTPTYFSSSHGDCKRRITLSQDNTRWPFCGWADTGNIPAQRANPTRCLPTFFTWGRKRIQLSKRCVYFGLLLKHWTIDDVHKISRPLWIRPSSGRQGKQSRSVGTAAFITTQRWYCDTRGLKVRKTVYVYNCASWHEDMKGRGGVVLQIVDLGTRCSTEITKYIGKI
jgi:hypothetical protein